MLKMTVVNDEVDHFLVTSDEPMRIEVSLIPTSDGHRVIMHGYRGATVDPEQEPDIVYDGSEHAEMQDMEA